MKLWEILRFEVGYQSRRLWTWLYLLALLGVTFQITTEAYSSNARSDGYLFNSPFVVLSVTILVGAMSLLATAGFAGDAGARDVETRMHALMYAAPVGKGAYLRGRFLGAFALSAVVLLAVQAGMQLAFAMPGVPSEILGPFRPTAFASAYLLIALPNAFVATAIFFALSALTRRAIAGYVGAVLLAFIGFGVWLILAVRLGRWDLARILDPLCLTIASELSRSTTAAQKNTLSLVAANGLFLNRVFWLGIAGLALGFTHARFRFAQPPMGGGRATTADPATDPSREIALVAPITQRSFGAAMRMQQTWAIASHSFREIAFGWGGLVLVALTLLLVSTAPSALNHLGVPFLPTTGAMVGWAGKTGEILWMIVPILTAFYAGELVWRDRETRLNEIADAAPVPDWTRLMGRFAGLALVIACYHLLLMVACMVVQLRLGYHALQPGLYARVFFGLQVPTHLLFVALALAAHVVVNQKYVGHLVVIGALVFMTAGSSFGVEHNLLVYGASPDVSYSDMTGFAGTLAPWVWFKVYWAGWAVLLLVVARVLWVRGNEQNVSARLKIARGRWTPATMAVTGVGLALVVGAGTFVFYNTNVLHAYVPRAREFDRQVAYERTFGKFRNASQPIVTAENLRVEIYPESRTVNVHGTYTLVNRSSTPIDSIHFAPDWEVRTGPALFDRETKPLVDDRTLGHRIYALQTPLAPRDSVHVTFDFDFSPRGFTNWGVDPSVIDNGTYFDGNDWLPGIGYQSDREVSGAGDRRDLGLPPRPSVRTLEDTAARYDMTGAEQVAFDVVVGTSDGQTAVAPGALRRSWTENGRRYFHYVTDAPIRNDFGIFSAAYATKEAKWNDVAIQVLYHPAHSLNVDRAINSMRASLEYYTKHFGPDPYRLIRLVERPGDSPSLHASPVNMWFQEGFALLNPDADPRHFDFAFAVVAHEMAHHWWGNQVTPAFVQGGALLSESLAWYSAICVVQNTYGDEHVGRLLDMMREEYLQPHSRAAQPLLRAYDRFIAYRKGPFAMYALHEYIGADRVETALRRLLQRFGAGTPPLPTSLDLYAELRAVTPDSLQYLLGDLFERNTFWELATKGVSAERVSDGMWRVTMDVQARKVVVDTAGTETEVPMNDLVEIGVYAPGSDGARGASLYRGLRRIKAGIQQITVDVLGKPAYAGIDPRHLLIDVRGADNVRGVR